MAAQTVQVEYTEGRIVLPVPVTAVTTHSIKRRIVEVRVDRISRSTVYLRGYEEHGARFYHQVAKRMQLTGDAVSVRFGRTAVRIGTVVA